MADISHITLPDGNTYDIKDANATDTKVTQTVADYTSGDFEVLLSGTADNTTRTEGAKKTSFAKINPASQAVTFGSRPTNSTIGSYSYVMGFNNIASGQHSFAEGNNSAAVGNCSHSEGCDGEASGVCSHNEGQVCIASGSMSHAEGLWTVANHRSQHVFGEYNIADDSSATIGQRGNYVEIVGNGTDLGSYRSNARTLDWNGNEVLSGKLTVGTAPTNNMDVTTKLYVDTGLSGKQDTLTAGSNITIDANNEISATDTTYTAGTGINIDANNVISATGGGTITDVQVDGVSVVTSGVAEIDLTSKADAATTLSGYGITDANINNGTITLGSNTITPLTSHQDISGKVNKAGDTMTGNLTISNSLLGSCILKNNSYTINTSSNNGVSNFSGNNFEMQDSASTISTKFGNYLSSDGSVKAIISAHNKKTDGTAISNSLEIKIAKDGTKSYAVSDPAAFRSAIGAGTSSTNTTYTISTGDSNGQIKVTPSSGSAYNVSVKGLGSAAYLTADTAASANTVVKRTADKYIYATYYNSNIGNEDANSYSNVAVMFTSDDKWIRRTSRLNFAKYLTNQQIASPGYFVTLTSSWGSFGYSTPAQARSGLGLGSMATQNTGSWEPVHPYLWRNDIRSNMSHPSGMNYWTMPTAFPAKSGYTRFAIIHKCTDRHITFHWWTLNGNNQVVVYTNNWSGSTLTFSLEVLLIYLKDSNKW